MTTPMTAPMTTPTSSLPAPPEAVLLDRDGTLNVAPPQGGYVTRPGDLALLPGVGDALRRLRDAGVATYVVTNQRGIARGLVSADTVELIHDRLRREVARAGGRLDGVYVCPHEVGRCGCRKPAPGLLMAVLSERRLDPARCVVVGDRETDVRAAHDAGLAAVLVDAGRRPASSAEAVVSDLSAAVDLLIGSSARASAVRAADPTEGTVGTSRRPRCDEL